MSDFWIGYLACIATYFAIGTVIGIWGVATHLAYFFAAGWQVKRMLKVIMLNAVGWPAGLVDALLGGE